MAKLLGNVFWEQSWPSESAAAGAVHLYAANDGRLYERRHGWARTAQAHEQLPYVLGCTHSQDPTRAKLRELSKLASEWLRKNQGYLELIEKLAELESELENLQQNFPAEFAEAQSIMHGSDSGTSRSQLASSRKKRQRKGPVMPPVRLALSHTLLLITFMCTRAAYRDLCAQVSATTPMQPPHA